MLRAAQIAGPMRILTTLTILLGGAFGLAFAQDVQHYHSAAGNWNYFSVDGASTAPVGSVTAGITINYARSPLVQRDADGDVVAPIVDDLTTFELMGTFGLSERLEVAMALPIGHAKTSTPLSVDDGGGIGDLRLLPKLILLGADRKMGLGVAVTSPMSFPTGKDDAEFSARHFVVKPRLAVEYRAANWRLAAVGGYRWLPTRRADLPELAVGNGVNYGVAVGVMPSAANVEFILETFGDVYKDTAHPTPGPKPLEFLGGFRFLTAEGMAFQIGAGGGLTRDFSAPEFRVVGGFSWTLGQGPARRSYSRRSAYDSDGDGVKDEADACPGLPEDRDGFKDADGCPDTDNDADGVPDTADRCPLRAEDVDGYQDEDGCPDLDNDGDGLPDHADQCPSHPEDKNGVKDSDGCPDDATVVVEYDRIRHLRRIYFDTNEATIKQESHSILDDVAATLRKQPELRKIRIDGHTDAFGSESHNEALALARAQAVRAYLIKAGVNGDRLEALGQGESNVVGDGRSESDAKLSRRVEFIILQRGR